MGGRMYYIPDLTEAVMAQPGFDYETAWVQVSASRRVALLAFARIVEIEVSTITGYQGLNKDGTHYAADTTAEADTVLRIVSTVRAHVAATTRQPVWNQDPFRSQMQPAPAMLLGGVFGPSMYRSVGRQPAVSSESGSSDPFQSRTQAAPSGHTSGTHGPSVGMGLSVGQQPAECSEPDNPDPFQSRTQAAPVARTSGYFSGSFGSNGLCHDAGQMRCATLLEGPATCGESGNHGPTCTCKWVDP